MSLISSLAASLLVLTPHATAPADPPPTPVESVVDDLHGQRIEDPYRWLEALESESEAVREWTTSQNDHTRAVLDALPCRAALEERLSELMTVGSIGAPEAHGNRYFYRERSGDQNQPILFVRDGHDGAPRQLLDPNTLDAEGLYALDWFQPSWDGELLAFGLSYAGDEMTVLHVLDVSTGEWHADEIPGKVTFGGWAPDNRSFLYGMLSDPANPYSRTWRYHELGRHHRQDPVLLTQQEPSRVPFMGLSRDGNWMFSGLSRGWSENDLFVVDANAWRRTGTMEQVPVAVDRGARFIPAGVLGDRLFMTTTLDAPNGRVIAVNLHDPAESGWTELIPERDDAVLKSVAMARGMLVATYEKNATTAIERFATDGTPLGPLPLPGLGTASVATSEDRSEAFLRYMSYNEPRSIYRVDLNSGERELWARPEVPVDPSQVEVSQVWCSSADGTRVPMFIVHRKGLELDGTNPTLLYGYGGFNASMTPFFSATYFAWFEAGGVYAVANLRGGGEFGEAWHQAGMLGQKQNVFDDLYACAEFLIDAGYTSPDHLAVMGGSNGGLLTGVAAVQRPDLWTAVVSAVPLLDMLRYHQFLMARFWVPEYGSAEDPEAFVWLRSYSPYHNITTGTEYPAVLFTAGENDSRVHPLHARKMAAAMQSRTGSDQSKEPILLWVDRSGGHGQGKPLALRIRDVADWMSFVMWQTGACGN